MTTNQTARDLLPEMSIEQIVRALWRRKISIMAVALACGIAAGAGSYLLRPTFRAEVLVMPNIEEQGLGFLGQFGALTELAGLSGSGQGSRAVAIATLKSRSLTEPFIEERGLMPLLFEDQWDMDTKTWKSDDPKKIPTLWHGYRVFDRNIRRIQEDRRTGLVTVAIEWHDAAAAAEWANDLVRRANAKLQQETILEGQKTIAYLEQQLARAGAVEVRQALYGLIETETKRIAVAHAREQFGFKVIDAAVPPKRRIKPNRIALTLTGLIIGFLGMSIWTLLHDRNSARA